MNKKGDKMSVTTVVIIGCGGFGRYHLGNILKMRDSTKVVAIVEPSKEMIESTSEVFKKFDVPLPPVYSSLNEFLGSEIKTETAFIITPHNMHFSQTKACLEAGIDVLLEKPMVLNGKEALDLIDTRNKTGRLLVVAFTGSLSPAIHKVKELLAENAIGKVVQVAGLIYQDWKESQKGKWRQVPQISGGGFLFDTGSHMINTVVDILNDDIDTVFAIQDNKDTPVDICSIITAKTTKGILINLTGAGFSIGCDSEIFIVGTKGIIRTGAWGEKLEMRREGEKNLLPVKFGESKGVWEQFLKVRSGKLQNPCPPEVGLRLARLMDMINASAGSEKVVTKK
jgi:predicted dehydrogenase